MNTWTNDFWIANAEECKKTLMEPGVWEKVPYYEPVVSGELPKTLVRFRGMIQDMLNPEYYCKSFSIFNTVTNETKVCQGKYQSTVISKPNEEITMGDDMMERQVISCIPIPGLNDWAKEIMNLNNEIDDQQSEANVQKRIRLNSNCVTKEMIIFIYPEDEESTSELKLNNIIEVIGFIDRYSIDNTESADSMITDTNPNIPVLSIHTVQFKLFPDLYKNCDEIRNCIWKEASNLQVELKFVLTQALMGDSLAANYLLFYLISTIYNRQGHEVPGKISFNIRGMPFNIGRNYNKQLYSLISYLVEKSKYLPLTVDNMNKMNMIPSKNYATGRLTEGFLQLSNRTHLFIDENDLQAGQLDNKGLLNVKAIKSITENQKLEYDFTFYKIDYETQIPILTISEGKSLVPCDIDIVLTPDKSCLNIIDNIIDSVHKYLNSNLLLLDKLRKYISLIATFPFTFNEDILNIIQKDYVEMRKNDAKNVSPHDLHRFIMISKLIALSTGKNELNNDIWEQCKKLESERRERNNKNKR